MEMAHGQHFDTSPHALAVMSLRLAKAPGGRSGTRESGAGTAFAELVTSGVNVRNAKYSTTCEADLCPAFES